MSSTVQRSGMVQRVWSQVVSKGGRSFRVSPTAEQSCDPVTLELSQATRCEQWLFVCVGSCCQAGVVLPKRLVRSSRCRSPSRANGCRSCCTMAWEPEVPMFETD